MWKLPGRSTSTHSYLGEWVELPVLDSSNVVPKPSDQILKTLHVDRGDEAGDRGDLKSARSKWDSKAQGNGDVRLINASF